VCVSLKAAADTFFHCEVCDSFQMPGTWTPPMPWSATSVPSPIIKVPRYTSKCVSFGIDAEDGENRRLTGRARALLVHLGHHVQWDVIGSISHARQGRHYDAMLQRNGPDGNGFEELGVFCSHGSAGVRMTNAISGAIYACLVPLAD
jgi:hypothetical protein